MGRKVGYLFRTENQLDRSIEATRRVLGLDKSGGNTPDSNGSPLFAKITSIVTDTGGKEAKAVEVQFNGTSNSFVTDTNFLIFDSDNIANDRTTTNIHSDSAMKVGDVIQEMFYPDVTEVSQWLAVASGGADRPAIITPGATFTDGAQITSPSDETAIVEFDPGQFTFKGLLPWGDTINLPSDFKFIGDLFDTTYFTQSYPKTLWAKVGEVYPTSGGITTYQILDARSSTGVELDTGASGRDLILQDFDNTTASLESRSYYNGKYFACSYNYSDDAYYFDFNLFGT